MNKLYNLILICLSLSSPLFAADIELTLDTPTNGTIVGAGINDGAGDLGETQYFIMIPEETPITALKIDLNANPQTHDIDLHVRLGQRVEKTESPEFTSDFRSAMVGAGVESVTIFSPAGGMIYIGIINWETFPVDFTLTATATTDPNGFDIQLASGDPVSDTITQAEFFGDGGKQYLIDVPDESTGLRITLEPGDPNTDFQLYVRFVERVLFSRSGVFAFSIDPRFQADLDAGFVSADFQQEFIDHLIFLYDNTPIHYTEENEEWHLTSADGIRFFIRPEENQLNVYQAFFFHFFSAFGGIESVTLVPPLPVLSGRYYIGVGHQNLFDLPFTLTATVTADANGFDVELTSGKPAFDIATDPRSTLVEKQYFIDVPTDATQLTVELTSDASDINLDLHIRLGSRVGFETPDFVAATPGIASESITISSPLSGRYYIGIVNWQLANNHTEDVPFRITATLSGITTPLLWDINGDGVVNILDLVTVGSQFGRRGVNLSADINADGKIDIFDLVAVGAHFGESTNPAAPPADLHLSSEDANRLRGWLIEARAANEGSAIFQRGITVLEHLLNQMLPNRTRLLANYPNPFNPETWIPYQLSDSSAVQIQIHDTLGKLVRTLNLGNKPAGYYLTSDRAAYWDGRSELGERVSSGIYFYTLITDSGSQTRKLVIAK